MHRRSAEHIQAVHAAGGGADIGCPPQPQRTRFQDPPTGAFCPLVRTFCKNRPLVATSPSVPDRLFRRQPAGAGGLDGVDSLALQPETLRTSSEPVDLARARPRGHWPRPKAPQCGLRRAWCPMLHLRKFPVRSDHRHHARGSK